ncbi:16S rRNA (guanine(527)-N(7))-methyltransferase RsmG [Porphyromonadaceae bacterium OttesenSCG-928-L07]|nr:16S rRNA (guanine(527)-N(7))-methyltransferase RsmG [Porphyromonadaceae bacterium OttesenSCG-928-L07]
MDVIETYFPSLTSLQKEQFTQAVSLYKEWNEKINVISRKDIDSLCTHHILHSLAIAKVISFKPGTQVLDVGTGGGFPGIPLAIMFPETDFYLVDSIGKKIKVVQEVASALGLKNVKAEQIRAEELKMQFDFVVSRAVTAFPDFVKLIKNKLKKEAQNEIPNGLLYLKGGDFEEEIKPFKDKITIYPISQFFTEDFFETKKVIYLKG